MSEAAGHGIIILVGWMIFYVSNIQPPPIASLTVNLSRVEADTTRPIARLEAVESISSQINGQDSIKKKKSFKGKSSVSKSYHLDSLTFKDLVEIGLSHKMAYTWLNYIKAGGRIRYLEDVERLYGIQPSEVQRLKKALKLHPSPGQATGKVDINTAGPEDLRRLPGIGPVLSKRIVKFRDKLGGFVHISQVAETYGISDSLIQVLAPRLKVSKVYPSLKINEVSADSLAKHPYVSWKQARTIVRYRQEHGAYKEKQDLIKAAVVDSAWVSRIEPYIDWQTSAKTE